MHVKLKPELKKRVYEHNCHCCILAKFFAIDKQICAKIFKSSVQ